MSKNRRNQRRNAFVAGLLTLAGFAVPAAAAEQSRPAQDNITPMSASQNAILRHGAADTDTQASATASQQSVPASRSQIEVLDLNHVHHPRVTLASH
ncbi:hypothetical protein T5B8_14675 [Salinisphaera sp. T5B8]|uniref:hypothetical protein n=1 Tax=Salinisphaera sp. T5B8 TaxID=1304154 RepID=UPI00333F783E